MHGRQSKRAPPVRGPDRPPLRGKMTPHIDVGMNVEPNRDPMDNHTLLQPISEAAPCGQDLSFSSAFDQIAEMRREDDPTLEQGEWVTSLKVADWSGVVQACRQLLQEQTKDLRVAAWMTEGLALTQGLTGLAAGIDLSASLCERYWTHLHPLPDGHDQEERIGTLTWQLQRIAALVDVLPVVRNRAGQTHALRDWQHARQPQPSAPQGYGQPEPQADLQRPTLEQLQRVARDTPSAYWQTNLQALRDAVSALARWQTVVDAQLGADGPAFVRTRDKLTGALDEVQRLARDAGMLGDARPATDLAGSVANLPDGQATEAHSASVTPGAHRPAGAPQTRQQALQQLREVADFFRRTEPHSPVAYLADKAVKWGQMPLHEWLRQVVKDQGSMDHLQELLGLDGSDQPTAN